ncbi:WD repeat-containing protein, partial [Musa troglodytarum]
NIVAAFLLVNNEFSIKRQTVIKCWRRRDYYPISSIPPRPPPRRCSAAAAFPSLADDLFPRWLPSPPSPVRSLLLLGPNREPVNLTPIPIAADRRVGFRRILDFPSRDFSATIPYIKNPSLDPQFRVYFSKEWFDALHLSFRNFLSEISTEKNTVKYLKDGIKQLNNKLSQLQALLETKEAEILYLQRKLSWGILVGCRFSASGMNIASASVDGTVRIWTYDSSTPTSRNATIYCGAEIMSLDWECRSDRLGQLMEALKLGMLMLSESYVILAQQQDFQGMAFISLTKRLCFFDCLEYENMEGHVLPLGEDPPAITSLCFNHNGKILAASAADGMIHIYLNGACKTKVGFYGHEIALVRSPIYQFLLNTMRLV